jgi:hypothetical protein
MNRRDFFVSSCCLAAAGCQSRSQIDTPSPGLTAVQPPSLTPAFSLPDMNGDTIRSAQLSGKVAILRFWATW